MFLETYFCSNKPHISTASLLHRLPHFFMFKSPCWRFNPGAQEFMCLGGARAHALIFRIMAVHVQSLHCLILFSLCFHRGCLPKCLVLQSWGQRHAVIVLSSLRGLCPPECFLQHAAASCSVAWPGHPSSPRLPIHFPSCQAGPRSPPPPVSLLLQEQKNLFFFSTLAVYNHSRSNSK